MVNFLNTTFGYQSGAIDPLNVGHRSALFRNTSFYGIGASATRDTACGVHLQLRVHPRLKLRTLRGVHGAERRADADVQGTGASLAAGVLRRLKTSWRGALRPMVKSEKHLSRIFTTSQPNGRRHRKYLIQKIIYFGMEFAHASKTIPTTEGDSHENFPQDDD